MTPREPNRYFDIVATIWFPSGVAPSQRSRVGKLAADFAVIAPDLDEIMKRVRRWNLAWPGITCTPEGLVKHWDLFQPPRMNKAVDQTAEYLQRQREAEQQAMTDRENRMKLKGA